MTLSILLSLLIGLPSVLVQAEESGPPPGAIYLATDNPFQPYVVVDKCPDGMVVVQTDWPRKGDRACRGKNGEKKAARTDEERIEAVCEYSSSYCTDLKEVYARAQELERLYQGGKKPVPPAALEQLNLDAAALRTNLRAVIPLIPEAERAKGQTVVTGGLQAVLNKTHRLGSESVKRSMTEIDERLDGLKQELAGIEAGIADQDGSPRGAARLGLANDLGTINVKTGQLWPDLHKTGLNIDYLGPKSYRTKAESGAETFPENPSADLTRRMNDMQADYAEIERRIREADRTLGTGLSPPRDGVQEVAGRSQKNLKGRLVDPFAGDVIVMKPMVIEAKAPSRVGAPKPEEELPLKPVQRLEIKPDIPSPETKPKDPPKKRGPPPDPDMYLLDTAIINLQKLFGGTETVGDPEGRAKYTFHQRGGTCGVASQVVMIAARDDLPADPKTLGKMEDEMYMEAVNRGFFTGDSSKPQLRDAGGTPWQFMGNLLDQPVRKQVGAATADLEKAVKSGKMILANANTGILWNNPEFADGGHLFVITGAEVEKKTGKVLGYYINDTGTNHAKRFITARQFLAAWKARGSYFVEPL